jgi:hypothetical protein
MDARSLKSGMKGYGLTVVKGTKVERFGVEIIGVLHHALPKQDLILIRCSGLNLEHSGVVAGMSGSPIYVTDPQKGDLLVGALSYGFPFNKDPVAGVTPIGDMLPELDRKLLPAPENQILVEPKKTAQQNVRTPEGSELQPVALPLMLGGFHPDVVELFRKDLSEVGFGPVHLATGGSGSGNVAGGKGKPAPSPPFEPGSAISLALVRGDMSMSGIGTVTWVRGDHFIAFGHPFKGMGQVHVPIGGADIQWILSSQSSSFKMGNALDTLGVLDQDRQPAVAGRTGVMPSWVPMTVTVRNKSRGGEQVWHTELSDQPVFFPMMAAAVAANAARVSEPIAESVGIEMKARFELEGRKPIEISETVSGLSGMQSVGDIGGLVGNVAKAITYNGFTRLRVKSIQVELEVSETRNLAFLEWVRTAAEEVEVGQPVTIKVGLMRPNSDKPLHVETLTLPPLPREMAGSTVTVQIGPEKSFPVEFPEPANVDDMLEFLRANISRNRLAAVVQLPEPTLMMRGTRLSGLPMGVRDELQGHNVQQRTGRNLLRTSVATPWALNGSASLKLKVKP